MLTRSIAKMVYEKERAYGIPHMHVSSFSVGGGMEICPFATGLLGKEPQKEVSSKENKK